MEEVSFVSFVGVCVMLGAVLLLFYQAGQRNSRSKRTLAFAVLLMGELLLFPWDSPVEWIRVAIIAGANYVLGADRRILDGVWETIRDLFRKPPAGGDGGSSQSLPIEQVLLDKTLAQEEANEAAAFQRPGLTVSELVRRMIWPDFTA